MIERTGAEAAFIRTDVGQEGRCVALVPEVVRRFGWLDLLVNNAATYPRATLAETTIPSGVRLCRTGENEQGIFAEIRRSTSDACAHGAAYGGPQYTLKLKGRTRLLRKLKEIYSPPVSSLPEPPYG